MPTYEYKNLETGEIYEFKQSMRDDALTHHPESGAPIKRIVSLPGIAFKGSGFYANDSRASSPSSRPAGDAASPAAEKPASAPAGESSPAPAKAAEPAPVKSAPAAVKSSE